MGNPYLEALQGKYDNLRTSIEGLQTRAVEEERDLTEDELRSAKEMGDQAKALATQIEDLTEIETRNRKVAELAASLVPEADGANDGTGRGEQDQTRGVRMSGGAQTRQRDPGHYTRSSEHSFFGDMYRSKTFGDELASRRLTEHSRALTTTGNGVGTVPPKWLSEEFETLARQGRAAANSVRNIPLGDDPRPLTLPKQTAGTSVADQAAENDAIPEGTDYDTDVDTVAPKPTAGKQIVSRQMLDMSSPAIDQLIFGDLMSVYNVKVESKVCAAIMAAGPAALAAAESGAVAVPITDDTHFANVTVDAAIDVRKARKLPASISVMSVGRYGKFLKLKDADGRPLMPTPGLGQNVNVVGVGSVAVDGIFEGLGIVATDGVTDDATYAVLRPSDVLLFESNLLRFRFEEQAGPESIVLGIWGYTATLVRQSGTGVQRVTVTPKAA